MSIRKVLYLGFVAISICFGSKALAAVDAGEITAVTQLTHTRIQLTLDGAATLAESLYICYFQVPSTDTTFVCLIDTTCTDSTLTGLSPDQLFIFFLLARDTDGKTNVSDKDTTYTYRTPLEPGYKTGLWERPVYPDSVWHFPGDYQTEITGDIPFVLNGADASDYSLVYRAKDYNGLEAWATQAGDSTVFSVYAIPVHVGNRGYDDSTFVRASVIADSMNVTSAGLTRDSLSLVVGELYQFLVYSFAGNGKNANIKLYFTSVGGY